MCGSHGLSARRARRTKSRGPKGLHLEVGARRTPRLLFRHNHDCLNQKKTRQNFSCRLGKSTSIRAIDLAVQHICTYSNNLRKMLCICRCVISDKLEVCKNASSHGPARRPLFTSWVSTAAAHHKHLIFLFKFLDV